jgi:hypothetical protein
MDARRSVLGAGRRGRDPAGVVEHLGFLGRCRLRARGAVDDPGDAPVVDTLAVGIRRRDTRAQRIVRIARVGRHERDRHELERLDRDLRATVDDIVLLAAAGQ